MPLRLYEAKTVKEFIDRMEYMLKEEKKHPEYKINPTMDRYILIIGEWKAFLRPVLDIGSNETLFVDGITIRQGEKIRKVGEKYGVKTKTPFDYTLSPVPIMIYQNVDAFIREMEERIEEAKKLGRSGYKLKVTKKGDQKGFLTPKRNRNVRTTIFIDGMNPDEGKKVYQKGIELGIETERPENYSIR